MTQQDRCERAVRPRARVSGPRYIEARAALDNGKPAEPPTRPFESATLKAHLEAYYGMRITTIKGRTRPRRDNRRPGGCVRWRGWPTAR